MDCKFVLNEVENRFKTKCAFKFTIGNVPRAFRLVQIPRVAQKPYVLSQIVLRKNARSWT